MNMCRKQYPNLVLSAAVAALLFTVSGCVCMQGGCQCDYNARAKKEVVLAEAVGPGLELALESRHSDISVRGVEGDTCTVRATVRIQARTDQRAQEVLEQAQVRIVMDGGRIRVVTEPLGEVGDAWVGVDYVIEVPAQTHVALASTHGKIGCRDLHGNVAAVSTHDPIECENIVGNLALVTTHDPIRLVNIRGNVAARTTHDPIHADGIEGEIDLCTSHDLIVCRNLCTARLKVRTSHDNVDVSFARVPGEAFEADVATSHGNITFLLPEGFSGEVSMSTTHGQVHTDVPVLVGGNLSEENLHGSIGNGPDRVSLRTSHGNIFLR